MAAAGAAIRRQSGIGVAVLPDYLVRETTGPELIELSPAGKPRRVDNRIHLAWRRGAVESARLAAARDALSA